MRRVCCASAGKAMQAAAPAGTGAMAALIGKVDLEIAEIIALEGSAAGTVVVANDNNVGNVVISGSKAGVEAAIAVAKTKGVKAISLPVSAPFHSPLMAPAAVEMEKALAAATINDARHACRGQRNGAPDLRARGHSPAAG
jgi:[acyl-carrier-protein] S-malonyltransferase